MTDGAVPFEGGCGSVTSALLTTFQPAIAYNAAPAMVSAGRFVCRSHRNRTRRATQPGAAGHLGCWFSERGRTDGSPGVEAERISPAVVVLRTASATCASGWTSWPAGPVRRRQRTVAPTCPTDDLEVPNWNPLEQDEQDVRCGAADDDGSTGVNPLDMASPCTNHSPCVSESLRCTP